MSYLVFALKYRPKSFDEVVGQAHVVTSLKNAILQKRVHHAYLFSGPRGVGKTSLARILAKSLNCSEGPTFKPCGKCVSCLEIAQGRSLDVIEIDGASNRGIDEIRTLREGVKLSTVHSLYKIYIIDEVHMLTQEAFNALLKTLEEPPAHVKFIFATTHPHKVLPTILSRCQKFQFNLLTLEEIVTKLKKIVKAEDIKIKENLLYTIGRASGGSIRDAESLLDQLAPVILEKESLEDIFSFLGIIAEESLNQMLKYLLEKDLPACLNFIDKCVKDGKDLGVFVNAFIEHLRNLLLAKVSNVTFRELSDVSPQSKDFILASSERITVPGILEVIDLLIEAKDLSQRLNTIRIPLELALVRLAYKGEIEKEALSQKAEVNTNQPKKVEKVNINQSKKAKEENLALDKKEIDEFDLEEADNVDLEEKKSNSANKGESNAEDEIDTDLIQNDDTLLYLAKTKWREIIARIQKTRAALASHLSFSQPVSSRGHVVTVAFSKEDCFHKEIAEVSKNLRFIAITASEIMGKSIEIKFSLQDAPLAPFKNKAAGSSGDTGMQRTAAVEAESVTGGNKGAVRQNSEEGDGKDDDFLNEILDTFEGKCHTGDS